MTKQHPSGKPIRNERVVGRPVWRIPDKGPVTPRLQAPTETINAVGFTAQLTSKED